MKKTWDGKIPVDADGSQLHFGGRYDGEVQRIENAAFDDDLTLLGFSRGRSAAYLNARRSGGAFVTIFLVDLEAMLPHIVNGVVRGRFIFCKRGQNYGCRLVSSARAP